MANECFNWGIFRKVRLLLNRRQAYDQRMHYHLTTGDWDLSQVLCFPRTFPDGVSGVLGTNPTAYDLSSTSSDALPFSYERLVGLTPLNEGHVSIISF